MESFNFAGPAPASIHEPSSSQGGLNESRLRGLIRDRLAGRKLVVVSNREPYLHVRADRGPTCIRPVGGLTLALDPILRACGGTWIAHGSGSADRETADSQGRLPVPPDSPKYTLRRVWLTPTEEECYYDGFANQGLWPLSHVAYTRPRFLREHWENYASVNRKFAQAVKEEVGTDPATVFTQDYHLALLPRLIRREIPQALVMHFWHVPWPNPEAFRICPWKAEILDGLLGSHLMAFQIQYHATNFLDTIDREIEARIDRERSTVSFGGQVTTVRPFPISVDMDGISAAAGSPEIEFEMARIRDRHRLHGRQVAVGVDRLDYTKGIPERLLAVERLLQRNSRFHGRFVLLQIAVPSRVRIPEYQNLDREAARIAARINERYGSPEWAPVILLKEHIAPEVLPAYFRAAHVCLVTSLHDGMNLIAKEFAAARTDRRGVLVLSRFTGAARELDSAVLVNPYAVDDLADALAGALDMGPEEQERRMNRMRAQVAGWSVFHWATALFEAGAAIGRW